LIYLLADPLRNVQRKVKKKKKKKMKSTQTFHKEKKNFVTDFSNGEKRQPPTKINLLFSPISKLGDRRKQAKRP
jgi:hypothetical protein